MCLRTLWAFIYPTNVGRPSPRTFSKEAIYDNLDTSKAKYKSIGKRAFVNFPLSPNDGYLLDIATFLKPWYGKVRVNFKEIQKRNVSINEIKDRINEVFESDFKLLKRGNTFYFKSAILSRYLTTFFVYKPLWKAIKEMKKEEFIKQWNKPFN